MNKSPLHPRALNRAQLTRGRVITLRHVVAKTQANYVVVAEPTQQQVRLRDTTGHESDRYLNDMGVVPYDNGGFSKYWVTLPASN